ncbi:alpha/beta fold hydrolase [Modestobacter versicolor]|uniref:Alpha/beta hydrolase n=1 Tax=Modestobacter versicolor TaxID=429133 RepID=A0A323VW25_9ACTN|nr:alpha/beta fold hydrolase [Modestobacter versicolor]MBB3675186.1 pimeloyl-ACP methyl ester carboxylesterase [Modestobacter versicolor]PZA22998.1 alpha/beta hydrolase [Modestobacter versicolor]
MSTAARDDHGDHGAARPVQRHRRLRRRVVATVGATVLAFAGVLVVLEGPRVLGDAAERPGLDAFYEQPPGATDGAPGTLVRDEALEGTPPGSRAWRVMYRSTDLDGRTVVVTAAVITPLGPAPSGGRTVLVWGHPTTGTAASCAPSRGFDPFIGIEGLRLMLDRGYTVVAPDYVGMGTDGPDSYLVGATAAHTLLDAVRAAQHVEGAEAGSRVVLWGHSQGGQAVLLAAEDQPGYAPELDVAAVAAAAPAADLTALVRSHLDDISGVTIGSYAFPAFAQAYGGSVPGARLEDVLTSAARQALPGMNRLCLLSHLGELHRIGEPLVGDFFSVDPTTTQPWAALLRENSAGSRVISAPVFVAQGAEDELVLPADTDAFVQAARQRGDDVHLEPVAHASHATIAYLSLPALGRWLDEQHV